MKEYIEREAVLAYPIRKDHCDKKNANEHFIFGIESVMEYVENLPAADVAPVRHGKWEPGNPICPVCGENKFKDLDADVWADWQPKFCPNCGALMDKEGEHEAD